MGRAERVLSRQSRVWEETPASPADRSDDADRGSPCSGCAHAVLVSDPSSRSCRRDFHSDSPDTGGRGTARRAACSGRNRAAGRPRA